MITRTCNKNNQSGFGALGIVLILGALVIAGSVGFAVYRHQRQGSANTAAASKTPSPAPSAASTGTPEPANATAADQTEGGKYLFIKEWKVRVLVPDRYKSGVAYAITHTTDPNTKLPLDAASILVLNGLAPQPNQCEIQDSAIGKVVTAASIILRSDASQPFNDSRYNRNGTKIAANVLTTGGYAYHVESAPNLCLGDFDGDFADLQAALIKVQSAN